MLDEYGDLVEEESSDEEGDKPEGEPIEDNPYHNINIGGMHHRMGKLFYSELAN
jgi:hypothetical protein